MKVRKILCSMLRLARWNFGSNLFSTLCRLPSIRPQGPLTRVSLCSEAKSKEKGRIEIKKVQMDVNPRRRRKAANLNSWVKKWSELFRRPGILLQLLLLLLLSLIPLLPLLQLLMLLSSLPSKSSSRWCCPSVWEIVIISGFQPLVSQRWLWKEGAIAADQTRRLSFSSSFDRGWCCWCCCCCCCAGKETSIQLVFSVLREITFWANYFSFEEPQNLCWVGNYYAFMPFMLIIDSA